jgi:heterodisulfide reductase subunit B
MGLAFGVAPEKLGLGKEFVDARPALAKIGVEIPEEPVKKKRPSKEELPMPQMPQEG